MTCSAKINVLTKKLHHQQQQKQPHQYHHYHRNQNFHHHNTKQKIILATSSGSGGGGSATPRLRNSGSYCGLRTTSFFTILMLVCLETVLLSTVSNCARTFYMHWNTSNSIFRIDNTDHIIDVNKGNSAFEFDQVHIICPVYEPGTYENETEKYIIYNVSKVEYETCRITNADPRVIAICDKPQKLMFFTITFRPFTPQPGGLEFLPGNDYYFISTSSKDDLYRRIGGRCSTNNMKVVFKVCCAPEQKNTTFITSGGIGGVGNSNNNVGPNGPITDRDRNIGSGGVGSGASGGINENNESQQHNNNIQTGVSSSNPIGVGPGSGSSSKSLNTNIDQFNRIQPINGVISGGNNGMSGNYNQQNGIRIIQQQNPSRVNGVFMPPMPNINTNSSNVVQSTMSWPSSPWMGSNSNNGGMGAHNGGNLYPQHSTPVTTIGIQTHFYPPYMTSSRPNINSAVNNNSNYSPSHKPTKKTSEYDKHPNEVVKNEELTYNSGASSLFSTFSWIGNRQNRLFSSRISSTSTCNTYNYYNNKINNISTFLLSTLNQLFIVFDNKLYKLLIFILLLSNSNIFLSIIINLNFLSTSHKHMKDNNNINKFEKKNSNNININNIENKSKNKTINTFTNDKIIFKHINFNNLHKYSSCKISINSNEKNYKLLINKHKNKINKSITNKKCFAIITDKNHYKFNNNSDFHNKIKNNSLKLYLKNYATPILFIIIVLTLLLIIIDILTINIFIRILKYILFNSFNLFLSLFYNLSSYTSAICNNINKSEQHQPPQHQSSILLLCLIAFKSRASFLCVSVIQLAKSSLSLLHELSATLIGTLLISTQTTNKWSHNYAFGLHLKSSSSIQMLLPLLVVCAALLQLPAYKDSLKLFLKKWFDSADDSNRVQNGSSKLNKIVLDRPSNRCFSKFCRLRHCSYHCRCRYHDRRSEPINVER